MSASPGGRDNEGHELFGYLACGLTVSLLIVYALPAVGIGIALGCLGAAAVTSTQREARTAQKPIQTIVTGVAILAAYAVTRSLIGAGGENRHLSREWNMGRTDFSAFLHHPWAWVPVACGTALLVGGIVNWLQSR